MENLENLEQPQNQDLGSKENLGKFKDAQSLLKAYNNLEAEFTKKSQRLSMLESENEKNIQELTKRAELERKVDEFVTRFESVKPFSSALKESLANQETASLEEEAIKLLASNYKSAKDYATDTEFLNNYIFNNQEIKEKIVKDYLGKITQNSPIKVDGSTSSISLSPPSVPTTIQEAGRLAKSIIKQK